MKKTQDEKPAPGDGRVLLFTGKGKGKTTAALGMVLRAAGHGMPVMVFEFIKADASTGEIAAARHLPGVEIVQAGRGFVPHVDSPAFIEHRRAAEAGLRCAADLLASGRYGLVVLDEVVNAVARGLLAEAAVVAAVRGAAPGTVVVMTGRNATAGLAAIADTVTEMQPLKHGYESGHKARKGVEF